MSTTTKWLPYEAEPNNFFPQEEELNNIILIIPLGKGKTLKEEQSHISVKESPEAAAIKPSLIMALPIF